MVLWYENLVTRQHSRAAMLAKPAVLKPAPALCFYTEYSILVPVAGHAGFSRVALLFSACYDVPMAFEHAIKAAGLSVGELLPSNAL